MPRFKIIGDSSLLYVPVNRWNLMFSAICNPPYIAPVTSPPSAQ
jgi:hypothetical protein